jgi:hypothetical protein
MRAVVLLVALLAGLPASALECDQYYAWNRTIADATEAINAKVNLDIADALAEVNARADRDTMSCHAVEKRIVDRFIYLIFLKPETWATNTSLVDRVPQTPGEELTFRKAYVYGRTSPIDIIRWMPPSPTIEVAGVRLGTDKLSHLFSEGLWYHRWYRAFRERGLDDEAALKKAVLRGVMTERTILGGTSSGVLSLGDLEANYSGMRFYNGFCDAPEPNLTLGPGGWTVVRPFDLALFVSPEWDESWQPDIFSKARWKKVRPVLEGYCGALEDPAVAKRREAYRAKESMTVSEAIVLELVAKGKLADPAQFTIDAVCGLPKRGLSP